MPCPRRKLFYCGDLNVHVESSGDGYEGVHGGYGFGPRNVVRERILEFGDEMEMIVLMAGL